MIVVAAAAGGLFGLIWGSFLNVVALRTLEGRSIVRPPSRCPHCGVRLGPRELIPVASFALQRGRCRHCGAPISLLYPFGELLTGGLMAWIAVRWAEGIWGVPEALGAAAFASLLVTVTVADLHAYRIPNPVLIVFAPILFVLGLWVRPGGLWAMLSGALFFGAAFWLIYALSRGGMGFGDVKYATVLGLWLGPAAFLPWLLIASLSGLMVAGGLLFLRRITRKDALPFGPFMSLAGWLVFLYGEAIIRRYMLLWWG
ncbi:MAG: prepilin peptidase [Hydrogenibacillus schlegelii]|uniref:Prepilin peptidase n=1 Tax=Hydrogenibacillus schlegelii TaxID=1484 RepID=A0A947GAF7_HYDSH|nr:prepilin peptidase [Hydrogenibacillus schlegelii]